MSSESISKLPAPLQQLIHATCGPKTASNPAEEQAVNEWVGKIAGGSFVKDESSLKTVEETLTPKTYLVGSQASPADIALYGTLHPIIDSVLKQSSSTLYSHPAVTRYFDHIQNLASIRSATDAPALIPLEQIIKAAPKLERKAPEPTKKKAKQEAEPTEASAAGGSKQAAAPNAPAAKEKKEKQKKEAATGAASGSKKGAAGAGPSGAAPAADAGDPSPAMIDLRVGHIVGVKKHPDADGLYVEQIDVGEAEPRTIISGLVNYIPIEQMQDKWLIVVANLKPVAMRGIKSYGMVLCASHKDGKEGGIEIVDPPTGCKPGDRVFFEGEKYEMVEPLPQLNPKKKIFENIQPGFTTLEGREAAWVDPNTKSVHRLMTSLGPCTAPTFVGASLS